MLNRKKKKKNKNKNKNRQNVCEVVKKFVKARNGRLMMKCTCAKCGITKTKFREGKLFSPSEMADGGIGSTISETGLHLFVSKGFPWMVKG